MNIQVLYDKMLSGWKNEFPLHFIKIYLDKGQLFGVKVWSIKGDTEEIILRPATKYEIVIDDIYRKLHAILAEQSKRGF